MQIIPSSGLQSCTLWDAPDIPTLEMWLAENINIDCTNQVFEVRVHSNIPGLAKQQEPLRPAA